MKDKIKNLINYFFPHSRGIAAKTVISSFLVSYLFIARLYQKIYQNQIEITELFTGTSVFKNYYKPADFLLPRYFLLLFVFLFLGFSLYFNLYKEKKALQRPMLLLFPIAAVFFGLKKYYGISAEKELALLAATLPFIAINYFGYSKMSEEDRKKADDSMDWILSLLLLAYFAIRLLVQIFLEFEILPETVIQKGMPFIFGAAYIICAVLSLGMRKGQHLLENLGKWLILWAQILLCFFPLLFWKFAVLYYEKVESFTYGRLQVLSVLLCILFLAYFGFRIYKKKTALSPITFMIVGAMQLSYQYGLSWFEPVNLFHNGELTVPMQQLSQFHKVPFLQFFPIHGMCDYYFQFWNQLLFDGSYSSFNMAYYLGSVLLCCIAAYIYQKCIKRSSYALAFIVFFSVIGEWYYYFRFIFVLPLLLLFFYKPIRESFFKTFYLYIVASILSIAWYPAIGGTLAVALLPIVVCRGFSKEGKAFFVNLKEREFRIRKFWEIFPVLIAGICFIPFFWGILRYLKENMGISQFFPGDMLARVVDGSTFFRLFWIESFWQDPALICFSFLIPILILTFWAYSYKKNCRGIEATGVVILFSYLLCSYTFGSISSGERALIFSIVLLLFTGFIIISEKKEENLVLGIGCLVFAAAINSFQVVEEQGAFFSYYQIPENYIKVDGKELGYSNMGEGFLVDEEITTLKNMAFIVNSLCSEEETFMDFTNQPALYLMLEKSTPFAYTSLYHGTSEATQEQMLQAIRQDPPKVILVSPYWVNEGGAIPLKHKAIYQYFMDQGYRPYLYENVCFMLADGIPCPEWATDGMHEFMKAMSESRLQGLPAAWGNADLDMEFKELDLYYEIVDFHEVVPKNDGFQIVGEDPYIVLRIDIEEEAFQEGEYLKFHFTCPDLLEQDDKRTNLACYFSNENGGYNERNAFSIKAINGDLLVPMYSYPIWTEFHYRYLRIDVEDERLLNADFNLSFELLSTKKDDHE